MQPRRARNRAAGRRAPACAARETTRRRSSRTRARRRGAGIGRLSRADLGGHPDPRDRSTPRRHVFIPPERLVIRHRLAPVGERLGGVERTGLLKCLVGVLVLEVVESDDAADDEQVRRRGWRRGWRKRRLRRQRTEQRKPFPRVHRSSIFTNGGCARAAARRFFMVFYCTTSVLLLESHQFLSFYSEFRGSFGSPRWLFRTRSAVFFTFGGGFLFSRLARLFGVVLLRVLGPSLFFVAVWGGVGG